MKLKEWSDSVGVKYLTAYRWFKQGKLPVSAYQTDTGTIIVQEDPNEAENIMNTQNNTMSVFLKKTVEFSKNNSTIEDFAAYIISNFSLRPNNFLDTPKYSKNKPKPEDIRKHFDKFLKPKGEKPKPNMFISEGEDRPESIVSVEKLVEDYKTAVTDIKIPIPCVSVQEGIDIELLSSSIDSTNVAIVNTPPNIGTFKPTQKEIDSANKVVVIPENGSKKSSKKKGK